MLKVDRNCLALPLYSWRKFSAPSSHCQLVLLLLIKAVPHSGTTVSRAK